jgi:lysylphosphatidylglycerol synthetase-like protein (DUF2156 family)
MSAPPPARSTALHRARVALRHVPVLRRTLVMGVVALVAGTAVAASGVLDIVHVVVLSVLAVVATLAWSAAAIEQEPWPSEPRYVRPGGRADLSELAWAAFSRQGRVTDRMLRRVRVIAKHRLAAHAVVWDGLVRTPSEPPDDGWGEVPADARAHRARAVDLLGPSVVQSLTTAREVTPRTLEAWFRALDSLADDPQVRHPEVRSH